MFLILLQQSDAVHFKVQNDKRKCLFKKHGYILRFEILHEYILSRNVISFNSMLHADL